jgi:hypothetical protein
MPRPYIKWLVAAKKLYRVATTDIDIQTKFAQLAITTDSLIVSNTLITELEVA